MSGVTASGVRRALTHRLAVVSETIGMGERRHFQIISNGYLLPFFIISAVNWSDGSGVLAPRDEKTLNNLTNATC